MGRGDDSHGCENDDDDEEVSGVGALTTLFVAATAAGAAPNENTGAGPPGTTDVEGVACGNPKTKTGADVVAVVVEVEAEDDGGGA